MLMPVYHKADQIKEDEVGRACGMHGRGHNWLRIGAGIGLL
jgi:hypothetical protein